MSVTPDADVAADVDLTPAAVEPPEGDVPSPAEPATCLNCGSLRVGGYCSSCGQKAAPLNPTLKHFFHELTHELLHFDGKIFRSVRLLVTRPGFLTKEILAGRRASYVTPIRLYLVFSVLAFALGAAVPEAVNIQYTPSPGEAVAPEVQAQIDRTTDTVSAALDAWVPRAMFLLVPLLALFVMMVRRKSGLNYPQHLYFALHVLAFYFLLQIGVSGVKTLQVSAVVEETVWTILTAWFIGYFVLAFRAAYGTTIWGALWRSAVVLLLYFFAVTVALLSIVLPTMFGAWEAGAS
jgi:hypothetical protein